MITKFDTYQLYEKAQYIDFEMLYEKAKVKKAYQNKELVKKVVKDYKLNTYFALTFGTAIAFLIPVIQKMLDNTTGSFNIGPYEITLLTVFAIAEILNIHTDGIKRIGQTLKEKGISGLIKSVKENLLSIYQITKNVAQTAGKTIERFIEMFGYVSIGIPIWQTLVDITSVDGFDINTLPQKIGGLVLGVGAFFLKNLVGRIVDLLSIKSKPELDEDQKV